MSDVRLATGADAPDVGRTLADGFADDPVLGWVFREPGRSAKLHAFFGFLAREAFVPVHATYLVPGCCAVWTPPDDPPWPEERGERFGVELRRVCTDDDVERLGVLDAVTKEQHPHGTHWYLSAIATVPGVRGQGLGATVLQRSLEVVDAAALPAYLESTNPRNVPFYERHGFSATGRIELPDGPSLTAMWREPRPV